MIGRTNVGGGENVKAEVEYQTPLVTQILEGLVGKAQGANITPETVLKGFKGYRGQELVEGVYVPHGAYVWKKYEYTPSVTVENPSITVTHGGSIVNFPITDANFDLTKVSDYERFFDGFIGGATYPNISYSASTFKLYFKENSTYQPTIDSFVADSETTGSFVVSSATSVTPTSTTFSYSGIKELSEASIGTFLDFVVSDKETAYPDGGLQGGYWYEKFQLDPALFGCTKYAVDKFTLTERTSDSYYIPYSLDEIPKLAIITAEEAPIVDNDIVRSVGLSKGVVVSGLSCACLVFKRSSDSTGQGSATGSIAIKDTTIRIYTSDADAYYGAGIEYTLITMA